MKDYYTLLVDLAQERILFEELLDKQCRRRHNRAITKIVKLWKELAQNDVDCDKLFSRLLAHENMRVVVLAADICYRINDYKPISVKVLEMARDQVLRIYNCPTADTEDHMLAYTTKTEYIDNM